MDAQPENAITPSTPPHTSDAEALASAPSRDRSSGSSRTKRSRTKHACDECRRTQKKVCTKTIYMIGTFLTLLRLLYSATAQIQPAVAVFLMIVSARIRRTKPDDLVRVLSHNIYADADPFLAYASSQMVWAFNHSPSNFVEFALDHCSRMSKADAPLHGLPYLGNMKRPQLAYDSFRSPTVPSRSIMEGKFVHPSPSFSESNLSGSAPPSPRSVIISPPIHSFDVRYQADTSPVFVMPSPASTVVDFRPLQQPLYNSSSQQYLYNQPSAFYAPQVVAPVYEDSQHRSEVIHTGNASPLYSMNELLPQGALHGMDGRITDAHPLPEASYQLSSSTDFSYSGDPSLAMIELSQHPALSIPQTFEEKQIQPNGNHPHKRSRSHFPTDSDELAREILPFQHSLLPQTEGIYPLSTPQEEWSIGYSWPLYQSTPGSEVSGLASHQHVECYSDGY